MRKNDEMLSLAELKARLRRFCEKHRIQRLDVFGSAARGEAGPGSDVDLLVTLDESSPVSVAELLEMAGEAEEVVGRPVDFVLRPSLEKSPNRSAREHILSTAICVYGGWSTRPAARHSASVAPDCVLYKDTSEAQFRADTQKQDAVSRRIEIIGEATAHLSEETRREMAALPFRKMRGAPLEIGQRNVATGAE
jgi:uncharacterized protein